MTNTPYLLPKARMGYRMEQGTIEDSMISDGLNDKLVPGYMAIIAENIAEKYNITMEECDKLVFINHNRANKAIEKNRFKEEIVTVVVKDRFMRVTRSVCVNSLIRVTNVYVIIIF